MNYSVISVLVFFLFGYTQNSLMPMPESIEYGSGKFFLKSNLTLSLEGESEKLKAYSRNFLFRLDNRSHVYFSKDIKSSNGTIELRFQKAAQVKLGMDESYRILVSESKVQIEAETDIGAMRALETLGQLLQRSENGYFFPVVEIKDKPRFKWRGLLIDVARHWMPVDVIKRNIDGMALVKLNTLHLHLTEDQGFRIESKLFPKLHQMGSNGDFFSQEQIKDIIKYANDRGIRVMPEFDIPGHATSWFVGHPELASKKQDYKIEKRFGVMDPAINPADENTYLFLDAFLSEMSALFNDEYFHIGGDENNGKHWNENKSIQAFMKKEGLKDNHELQSYFNKRVLKILTKNNKKMVGWDEIFQEGIPNSIVIQSWRGKEALIKAAKLGYKSILSSGYYIDLAKATYKHYLNEPITVNHGLSDKQLENILGGEATMWAELITPETIDSRIWPRTAAIAERFWSPRHITDLNDMYARLERVNIQLENVGLLHFKNQDMMIRRVLGDYDIQAFKTFIEVIEPLKVYSRHAQAIQYTTDLPLTRLADITFPESQIARKFSELIERFIKQGDKEAGKKALIYLDKWINNHDQFAVKIADNPKSKDYIKLSKHIRDISNLAKQIIKLRLGQLRFKITNEWTEQTQNLIKEASKPIFETEIAIIPDLQKLLKSVN